MNKQVNLTIDWRTSMVSGSHTVENTRSKRMPTSPDVVISVVMMLLFLLYLSSSQ